MVSSAKEAQESDQVLAHEEPEDEIGQGYWAYLHTRTIIDLLREISAFQEAAPEGYLDTNYDQTPNEELKREPVGGVSFEHNGKQLRVAYNGGVAVGGDKIEEELVLEHTNASGLRQITLHSIFQQPPEGEPMRGENVFGGRIRVSDGKGALTPSPATIEGIPNMAKEMLS